MVLQIDIYEKRSQIVYNLPVIPKKYNLRKSTEVKSQESITGNLEKRYGINEFITRSSYWYEQLIQEFARNPRVNIKSWLKIKMFGRKVDKRTKITELVREADKANTWLQNKLSNSSKNI